MRSARHSASAPKARLTVQVPDELCTLLGVGRATAYRIARTIGRRSGRRLIVARSALEAWLNAQPKRLGSRR